MPLQTLQALSVVIAIMALLVFSSTALRRYKGTRPDENHITVVIARISIIALLASMLLFATTIFVTMQSARHGAYEASDDSLIETIGHIAKVPADQSDMLPQNPKNMLVYMFRYKCPDCEAVHHSLMTWLDSTNIPVLCVSSRSQQGTELRDQLHVKEVPSVIYFDKEGNAHVNVVYKREGDITTIDRDAIMRIEREITNG